jgi:hypothetical protein
MRVEDRINFKNDENVLDYKTMENINDMISDRKNGISFESKTILIEKLSSFCRETEYKIPPREEGVHFFIDDYIYLFRDHFENRLDGIKFSQLGKILEGLTKVTAIDLDNDGSDELYGDDWIISKQGGVLEVGRMGGLIKTYIKTTGAKVMLCVSEKAEGTRELYFFSLGLENGGFYHTFGAGPFSAVGYELKDLNNDGIEELICYRSADLGWLKYYSNITFPAIFEWTGDKFRDVTLLHKDILIEHYKKVLKKIKEGFSDDTRWEYDRDICSISPEYKAFWEERLRMIKI